jgi:hypothetical protein
MVFRKFVEYTFQFLTEAVFRIINFILYWGMNIQNNNMKPTISQYYLWHPNTNKHNSLNYWYDSLIYKRTGTQFLVPIPLSIDKICNLPLVGCHCPPIWLPALPLNLTYIWIVPSKLSLGSPPYTNPYVLRSKSHVHIPSLRSFIQRIR